MLGDANARVGEQMGNSLGLRIPRGLAEDARITEGSTLDVRVENGQLIAVTMSEELTLESLLSGVTADNLHGEQLDDGPHGREAW